MLSVLLGGVVMLASCAAASGNSDGRIPGGLLDEARARGPLLVIVTLSVPDPTDRTAAEAEKQSLLTEISGTTYRVVRELMGLPQIVLEASYDTLRALGASSRVLRVEEPTLDRPQR